MPKIGLSNTQWVERLKQYARGKYSFGRGERPPKESRWAIEIDKIEKCPKQGNLANYDPFGRMIPCTCRYHPQIKVSLLVYIGSAWITYVFEYLS